jgi:hypothetical protein
MGLDLRMPNITGTTEKEQLIQIKSYLYQLAQQLQWGLNTIETSSVSNQVPSQASQRVIVQGKEENAEATFNSLKALIIKSADIVDAYYDEITTRLEGMYVAQSDFGAFMEQTSQKIEQTSTYTDQKFNDVQVIITNEVDGLKFDFQSDMDTLNTSVEDVENFATEINGSLNETKTSLNETNNSLNETKTQVNQTTGDVANLQTAADETNEKVGALDSAIGGINEDIVALKVAFIEANAYIRSGLLYYDDNAFPVYGLEIGQRNTVNDVEVFNKFARFTSDRLSFYDQNDNEVAYVSDYKLYIRNVEITTSFKIGGFVDTVQPNGDVVTKWVGGDG